MYRVAVRRELVIDECGGASRRAAKSSRKGRTRETTAINICVRASFK